MKEVTPKNMFVGLLSADEFMSNQRHRRDIFLVFIIEVDGHFLNIGLETSRMGVPKYGSKILEEREYIKAVIPTTVELAEKDVRYSMDLIMNCDIKDAPLPFDDFDAKYLYKSDKDMLGIMKTGSITVFETIEDMLDCVYHRAKEVVWCLDRSKLRGGVFERLGW